MQANTQKRGVANTHKNSFRLYQSLVTRPALSFCDKADDATIGNLSEQSEAVGKTSFEMRGVQLCLLEAVRDEAIRRNPEKVFMATMTTHEACTPSDSDHKSLPLMTYSSLLLVPWNIHATSH